MNHSESGVNKKSSALFWCTVITVKYCHLQSSLRDWPPRAQEVSHQRWIWALHRWEKHRKGFTVALKTRVDVTRSPKQGYPVADLGFPRGGCSNSRGGAPTYYLTNFSRKLHENEEILVQRWGCASLAPPLRSPLVSVAPQKGLVSSKFFFKK